MAAAALNACCRVKRNNTSQFALVYSPIGYPKVKKNNTSQFALVHLPRGYPPPPPPPSQTPLQHYDRRCPFHQAPYSVDNVIHWISSYPMAKICTKKKKTIAIWISYTERCTISKVNQRDLPSTVKNSLVRSLRRVSEGWGTSLALLLSLAGDSLFARATSSDSPDTTSRIATQ